MRIILLTLLTICGFGMLGPASAQIATQYPVCIQGVDNPGWSGCSFSTFQECQAPRPAQSPNAFLTHGTNLVMTERRLRVECRLPLRTRAANRRLLSVHPRQHIEVRQSLFARSVGNDEQSQEIADHRIGNDGVSCSSRNCRRCLSF